MVLIHNVVFWLAAATPVADAGLVRRRPGDGNGIDITPLVTTTITSTFPPQTITNDGISLVLTPAASTITTVVPLSISKSTDSARESQHSKSQTSTKSRTSNAAISPLSSAIPITTSSSSSSSPKPPVSSTLRSVGTIFHDPSSTPGIILSIAYPTLKSTTKSKSTVLFSSSIVMHSSSTSSNAAHVTNSSSSSASLVSSLPGPQAQTLKSAVGIAYVTVTEYTTIEPPPTSSLAFTSVSGVAYVTATRFTTVESPNKTASGSTAKHPPKSVTSSTQISYSYANSADTASSVAGTTRKSTASTTPAPTTARSEGSPSLTPVSMLNSTIPLYPIPSLAVRRADGAFTPKYVSSELEEGVSDNAPLEAITSFTADDSNIATDSPFLWVYESAEQSYNSKAVGGLLNIIPELAATLTTASPSKQPHKATEQKPGQTSSTSFSWKWASGTPAPAKSPHQSVAAGKEDDFQMRDRLSKQSGNPPG